MNIYNEVKTLLECLSEPAILLSQNYQIFAANAAYRHHYHYGKGNLGNSQQKIYPLLP